MLFIRISLFYAGQILGELQDTEKGQTQEVMSGIPDMCVYKGGNVLAFPRCDTKEILFYQLIYE